MVINKKYLNTKDLNVYDWFLMHLVFLNSSEDMSEELIQYLPNEILSMYEDKKYITKVKAKKEIEKAKDFEINNITLSTSNVFKNSKSSSGQYIVIPKDGNNNWSGVRSFVQKELE